jgi:chromate reductase
MANPSLVALCGSLRAASHNRKLMNEAIRLFGPADVTVGDLNLPLYSGDLEDAEGIPAAVATLAEAIRVADAVLIASPEYNKAPSGVLKNALDWISRVKPGVWAGKPVAIMSASTGRAGGEVAQYQLRHWLSPFPTRVLTGNMVMVAGAADQFDADGRLVTESYAAALGRLMAALRAESGHG